MTDLAEKKFVESLNSSTLHQNLRSADQPMAGRINKASLDFMNAMVEQVAPYKAHSIEDFRCFESNGLLIGALYDKAFITYPEHFGEHVIEVKGKEDLGGTYCLDAKSFGLITSMVVCRDLSQQYEKQGDWNNVVQVLEAYFAIHDAVLSTCRSIGFLPDKTASLEIMEMHNLYLAFTNILRVKSKEDVAYGTYERLIKAREITSNPTLRMRIRKFLKVS